MATLKSLVEDIVVAKSNVAYAKESVFTAESTFRHAVDVAVEDALTNLPFKIGCSYANKSKVRIAVYNNYPFGFLQANFDQLVTEFEKVVDQVKNVFDVANVKCTVKHNQMTNGYCTREYIDQQCKLGLEEETLLVGMAFIVG